MTMDVPGEDAGDDSCAPGREHLGAAFDQLAGALRQVTVRACSARQVAREAASAFRSLGRAAQRRADEVDVGRAHVTTTVLPHLRTGREIALLLRSGIDGCDEVAAWRDATMAALATFDTIQATADGVIERSRAALTSCAEAATTAEGMVMTLEMLIEGAAAHITTFGQVGPTGLFHRSRPSLERTDRWLAERAAELPRAADVERHEPEVPTAAFGDRAARYRTLVAAVSSLDEGLSRWRTAYRNFLGELGSPDLSAEYWPKPFGSGRYEL